MKFDEDFLNVKFALINTFLLDADNDVLDISYSRREKILTIQLVLLEGKILSNEIKSRIRVNLQEFNTQINEIYISKKRFNENKGEWNPKYYSWLENVLFSKAEIL